MAQKLILKQWLLANTARIAARPAHAKPARCLTALPWRPMAAQPAPPPAQAYDDRARNCHSRSRPRRWLHPVFPMKSGGLFCPDCRRSVGKGGMEASTGIEPVYTDLQSAASPLRQLAASGVGGLSDCFVPCKRHPGGFGRKQCRWTLPMPAGYDKTPITTEPMGQVQ